KLTGVKVAETEIVNGKRLPMIGTEQILPADLVFLALGFTGPEIDLMQSQSQIESDSKGNVSRNFDWATNLEDVFVAGDAGRGQSLIVWAIAEGRAAAAAIDEWLTGETVLPRPVKPTDRSISIY
ncbi:MAG: FAD-dependent oxidoreductase, partial [Micrococcales bacterium]